MTRPRLYLSQNIQTESHCTMDDEARRYVQAVLRLGEGAHLLLFNGLGQEGEGVIDYMTPREARIRILRAWTVSPEMPVITLAQSLPKSGKMDFILQKATELGTHRIVPFISRRSIPRLDPDKAASKRDRWRKIVMEAARQCRRSDIPAVSPLLSFSDMVQQAPRGALRMILWEEKAAESIKGRLRGGIVPEREEYFVAVGPEGGFTPEEIAMAKEAGFFAVGLGRNILRAETAALAVITIIQYEKGDPPCREREEGT